ncbi:unnamed protein product [Oppiella nova]|uniref:Uncharacterized protein n=1 Tax=Oppiella nova TaxID=334625 RepID=A0A7R9MIC3_9ACAR|nr:unnamed protein product [Oppiella nova]CAG2177923.1 unnamed protein product [Oppiella nova]
MVGSHAYCVHRDMDVAREAFAKIKLTGRTNLELACLYCNEKHQDFSLNNNMTSWWALRNVMHKAISDDLSGVVDTIVTEMTAKVIATNQPINPTLFGYNMSMGIMGHLILNEKCVGEGRESGKHLTDDNIASSLIDVFLVSLTMSYHLVGSIEARISIKWF